MGSVWAVERTRHPRFPYRISIEQEGRLILAVRAQSAWPGPGQQIFCLRERALDPTEPLEPVERVPVLHLTQVGRKLTLALDRPTRKRCEFLTVEKPRKDGQGTLEQVFFRTEQGIRGHRSRSRVELRAGFAGAGATEATLGVVIDSGERYPWRFPGARVTRRRLAAGDYALLDGERVAAVVERKSFENLLGEVGAIQGLHHQLADLASHESAALVIEADYRDFLDAKRLAGRWPPAHLGRVLAEIGALHPKLPVIFAGNRAMANRWTVQFFRAVASARAGRPLELPLTVEARHEAEPRAPGMDQEVREAVLGSMPVPFLFAELARRFPEAPATRLRRILNQLRKESRLVCLGRGPSARWRRLPPVS